MSGFLQVRSMWRAWGIIVHGTAIPPAPFYLTLYDEDPGGRGHACPPLRRRGLHPALDRLFRGRSPRVPSLDGRTQTFPLGCRGATRGEGSSARPGGSANYAFIY